MKIYSVILLGLFVIFSYAKADVAKSPTMLTSDTSLQNEISTVFGKDSAKMMAILACESNYQQFSNGKPLLSKTNDLGISQVNISNWKEAVELGLDIFFSPLDNLKMAKYILDTQGFGAWTTYKTPCYYRNLVKDS